MGWFAPEYKLLDEAWREMKALLGGVARPNEQQKRLILNTGGTIDAWAFDRNPNAGRSRKYKRVIIDEAAHCENLEAIWTRCVRPTLTDYKGDAWFLSSPKGTNYFHTLFDLGQKPDGPWKSWKKSSYANPRLDPSEIEDARRDLPHPIFRQEYLADFLDDVALQLIPGSWLERCVAAPRAAGPGGPRRLAIDISKGTGRDRTVAIVADDLGVLHMEVSNRIDVQGAALLVKRLSAEWGVAHDQVVYDAGGWAGSDMGGYLEALGIQDAVAYRGGGSGGHRYGNRRTRSAWKLRQRLDPDRPRMLDVPAPPPVAGVSLWDRGRVEAPAIAATQPPFAIPASEHWEGLRQELAGLRYSYDKAKLELELKAKYQERLGRSPDVADALIMLAGLWD